jgi:hypothetical protein
MHLWGGHPLTRVYAKHAPDWGHALVVLAQMLVLGPPTIRVVEYRGELFALEGSHRLWAAHQLNYRPIFTIVDPERLVGPDEAFWDETQIRLPHYCWIG